jgi:hypothetical protein
MPDELEFLAGTDPLNPLDCLRFDVLSVEGASCFLHFSAHAGHTYAVEKLDRLGRTNVWTTLQAQITGAEGPVRIVDPLTANGRYYRLKVTAN